MSTLPADRIELRGIRAVGTCGLLPEEQGRPQPLEVDLDVYLDLGLAGASDHLDDTADYSKLGELVVEVISTRRFYLLERMARVVAEAVLEDPRVDAVSVTLRKLRPPVPYQLDTCAVRVTVAGKRA